LALGALSTIVVMAAGGHSVPAPLVLISIDGLRPVDVRNADRSGLRLPHLSRLRDEGTSASGVIGVRPSVTYPSHTTLVTGVSPSRHGILYNKPFDPLGRNDDGLYWYAEDIRVATLWDAASRAGFTTASVDWPVTVGAHISYDIVQYGRAGVARRGDDPKLFRALSGRQLLAEAERAVGPYPDGPTTTVEDDERRAAVSTYLLETKRPRLHLAYFAALDEAEHRGGPGSDAALRTLERLDRVVGRLREAAERAGGGRAVIAVVSDHGFTRTDQELDLNEGLRRAGLLQLDVEGRVRGWRAFTWGQGGAATVVLRNARDGEARQKVRAVLSALSNGGPVERVVEMVPGRDGSPEAAFEVSLRPDTSLVDRRAGFIQRPADPAGDHGHDPGWPEMDATFVVAGPGVPRGQRLGRVDMRDIAPTLAALLGVSLPDAEGRDLLATQASRPRTAGSD